MGCTVQPGTWVQWCDQHQLRLQQQGQASEQRGFPAAQSPPPAKHSPQHLPHLKRKLASFSDSSQELFTPSSASRAAMWGYTFSICGASCSRIDVQLQLIHRRRIRGKSFGCGCCGEQRQAGRTVARAIHPTLLHLEGVGVGLPRRQAQVAVQLAPLQGSSRRCEGCR